MVRSQTDANKLVAVSLSSKVVVCSAIGGIENLIEGTNIDWRTMQIFAHMHILAYIKSDYLSPLTAD